MTSTIWPPSAGKVLPCDLTQTPLWEAYRFGGLRWFAPLTPFYEEAGGDERLYDEAYGVYRTMLASTLVRSKYLDVSRPEFFFDSVVIPVRPLIRGMRCLEALDNGYVWGTKRHTIDETMTNEYWMELIEDITTPHAELFDRIARLKDPFFIKVKKKAGEKLRKVWMARVAEMDSHAARDWQKIIETQNPLLTDIAETALERHTILWIEALQGVVRIDDRLIKQASALDQTKYKAVLAEAVFAKMRVWKALDSNGERV